MVIMPLPPFSNSLLNMAKARVGGTKSKIRGQVGDIVYQVKRNDDGTYTQYTYLKGQRTEEVLTPRLQAQRMCMAIVESMMRDLKPVARISFQWAKTKTASLNAFSSNNLRLVQRDCQEHWYGNNVFLFPYRHRTDMQIKDEGGPFMLSAGSLSYNLYDVIVDDVLQHYQMQGVNPMTHHFLGLVFNCNVGTDTLDDLLQAHKMTLLDTVCFCVYREYFDFETDPDDPKVYYKHEFVIATFNQFIPGSSVLTPDVLKSLFVIDTKWQAEVFIRIDGKGFGIGHSMCEVGDEERQYYMGAFSISYYSGKKLISTSFYTTDDGGVQPWLMNEYPANNFGSWMGEPAVRPYPSPFE